MIINAEALDSIIAVIEKMKTKSFSIQTQYKFLKIYNTLVPEIQIINLQKEELAKKYAERDDDGNIIFSEDGGLKIKDNLIFECAKKLEELNSLQITIPDLYFSLSELEDLNLTLEELMYLDPFIKN